MTLQTPRRWWPVAAVAALVMAAAMASVHATPRLGQVSRGADRPDDPTSTLAPEAESTALPPADDSAGVDLPSWIPTLFNILLLALVAVAVVLLVWSLAGRLRRVLAGRDGQPDPANGTVRAAAEAEVLAALDAGVVDLSDEDGDPRRAVIACWLRLEAAAAAAGMPRQVGDTATDLVVRLLGDGSGGRAIDAEVLAGFADIYREARYARHLIDDRMRQQARAALRRLRAELTSTASR